MLYCMESLGKRYKDNDETYVFFEKVLASYLPFLNDDDCIEINEEHTSCFFELETLYQSSKSVPSVNWTEEEKMADSLAWYKASGIIFLKKGKYYINSEALKRKFLEYQDYREKKNQVVYSKGPKK